MCFSLLSSCKFPCVLTEKEIKILNMPICGVTYHPLLAESATSTQLHVIESECAHIQSN